MAAELMTQFTYDSLDDPEPETTSPATTSQVLDRLSEESESSLTEDGGDDAFNENFRQALEAIREGIQPELIATGSSGSHRQIASHHILGSYFVRNRTGEILAVFKPKDEEPFAPLNPRWPKFFQKWLCFCCFGRACLIPNLGYMSEVGASLVDDRLGVCLFHKSEWLKLNIVPKTRVVKIESSAFTYGQCCGQPRDPYPKEGSYQLFVKEYESAEVVLRRWDANPSLLNDDEAERFLYLFQKMCVLDYVIRNTDRHTDNWLIRHKPGKILEIAAIDNGLAFPVKHPEMASMFRHFPFEWTLLEWAKKVCGELLKKTFQTWHPVLRDHLLSMLTPSFVHRLTEDLKQLFRHDLSANRLLIHNQLRVLRGQLWNLRFSLEAGESPAEMAQRAPVLVRRRYKKEPGPTSSWEESFRVRRADSGEEKEKQVQ